MSITLDSEKLLFGYKVLIQFLILNLFFFFFFSLLRMGLAMWLLLTRYYFSSPALFQLLRAITCVYLTSQATILQSL